MCGIVDAWTLNTTHQPREQMFQKDFVNVDVVARPESSGNQYMPVVWLLETQEGLYTAIVSGSKKSLMVKRIVHVARKSEISRMISCVAGQRTGANIVGDNGGVRTM